MSYYYYVYACVYGEGRRLYHTEKSNNLFTLPLVSIKIVGVVVGKH